MMLRRSESKLTGPRSTCAIKWTSTVCSAAPPGAATGAATSAPPDAPICASQAGSALVLIAAVKASQPQSAHFSKALRQYMWCQKCENGESDATVCLHNLRSFLWCAVCTWVILDHPPIGLLVGYISSRPLSGKPCPTYLQPDYHLPSLRCMGNHH